MSLLLYRRHTTRCAAARAGDHPTSATLRGLRNDRNFRRCKCPIWAEGTLRVAGYLRRSMGEVLWEKAEERRRAIEDAGVWSVEVAGTPEEEPEASEGDPEWITVERAVEEFLLARKVARRVAATLSKYKVVLEQNLLTPMAALRPFCENRGLRFLRQVHQTHIVHFMAQWQDGARAGLKKHERLWSFFHFCKVRGYITVNPVEGMTKPEPDPTIKEPYTKAELDRIFDALHLYPDGHGYTGSNNAIRLEAMTLLLRYSGLSIGDAVALRRDRLQGNLLMTYRRKTGGEVFVPLPPHVVEALERMPNTYKGKWSESHPDYFFWTGRGLIKSSVANWQRSFRKLFALARVTGAHPHRFRHTFAVDLLQRGVPIEDVSMMLGHSSVTITEQHYAKWGKGRQEALEARVLAAWGQTEPSPPTLPPRLQVVRKKRSAA
jgi:integrase/recombinase XerD